MRCEFCNAEMGNGEIRCAVCGFTHINFTEADDGGIREKMRHTFAAQTLGGINIEVKVHRYTIQNGNMTVNEPKYIKIAEASELVRHEIKWLDTVFYGIEDRREIHLDIRISGKDNDKEYTLTLNVPKALENLKAGILLEDGLKAEIVVGNESEYVQSEQFSLIYA